MDFNLFSDSSVELPPHDRFPTNVGREIRPLVEWDLETSPDPLIITGYTSLDTLLEFLAPAYPSARACKRIRILIGHEPDIRHSQDLRSPHADFADEIKKYWTEQGISIYHSARALVVIEMLREGFLETRISGDPRRPVHAKIYKGEDAVTLGSSNFSGAGLRRQMEANARFTRADEPERFGEAGQLAEYVWNRGKPYDLAELLRALLQEVTWEEALARACAEVLEGDWAARYLAANPLGDFGPLWPTQEDGIRQALCILQNVGSVLVADATGSGKTRMGARLIRSEMQRIWRTGRVRQDAPVVVCPPNDVRRSWKRELVQCGVGIDPLSHGSLSRPDGTNHEETMRVVRLAQVLAIDEAHNFLNRHSQRTQALFRNMADTVLLFTATPINQGPKDLMALIDLLGPDNFSDEVLEVLSLLWRRRGDLDESISAGEYRLLRQAIQSFTVRRTKSMFNKRVDRDPDRYHNALGLPCRYPQHRSHLYACGETPEDREIAKKIRAECDHLRGLTRLRTCLQVTESQRLDGWRDSVYLNWRLGGAKSLAAHAVMDSLRSSRMALWEHLRGTDSLREMLDGAAVKPDETGNVMLQLQTMAGHPPGSALDVPAPDWLTNSDAHRQACAEELAVYERIYALSQSLTLAREHAKAAHLAALLGSHDKILAFDRHPITLCEIQRVLKARHQQEAEIATGSTPGARNRVNQAFALGADQSRLIALCSDALSEGINLQAASAVVLLDMPGVMRLAEQRVGRVDRMDSPHAAIDVYWPDDCDEFKLNTHERFFERYRCVAQMLGANMPLPHAGLVSAQEISREFDTIQNMESLDEEEELEDALAPVRRLIGPEGLVSEEMYARRQVETVRVTASVSAVVSARPWAFLAVAGTEWGAPQWVFLENLADSPETDFRKVSALLRTFLGGETEPCAMDLTVEEHLRKFVQRLADSEQFLLPRKKQKALAQMQEVLEHYAHSAGKAAVERKAVLADLLQLLEHRDATVNLGALAEGWLDLTRPLWKEEISQSRRTRPVLIRHLTPKLKARPLLTEDLRTLLQSLTPILPLDKRIAAAVIGVPAILMPVDEGGDRQGVTSVA